MYLVFFGEVDAQQLKDAEENLRALLADFVSGFRLLTDLERLESMSNSCGPVVGRMMELFKESGVEMVVRVIPKTEKDIGLTILSNFHYGRNIRTTTCENILEAARILKL